MSVQSTFKDTLQVLEMILQFPTKTAPMTVAKQSVLIKAQRSEIKKLTQRLEHKLSKSHNNKWR